MIIDFLSKKEAQLERDREFYLELARIEAKYRIPDKLFGIHVKELLPKVKYEADLCGMKPDEFINYLLDLHKKTKKGGNNGKKRR